MLTAEEYQRGFIDFDADIPEGALSNSRLELLISSDELALDWSLLKDIFAQVTATSVRTAVPKIRLT